MGRHDRRSFTRSLARCAGVLAFGLTLHAGPVFAEDDLLEMSLEELMNVEVTSVSKKAESKNTAAASIHVITAEDIRRGGFQSVPEALRVVPGVQVSRINGSRWAISIRGFREEFSNKLLVLIDGRAVYTPLFGGVVWGEQNVAVQDIARIEVIRGPGGAIWGANAVNGVINIMTKDTEDTLGGLAAVQAGSHQYGVTGRYGAKVGEDTTMRLTVKGQKNEDFDFNSQNYSGKDEWGNLRVGVRTDTAIDDASKMSLHVDYFDIDTTTGTGQLGPGPFFPVTGFRDNHTRGRGGNVLLKYDRTLKNDSTVSFKTFYDVVDRRTVLDERSHTFEASGQYNGNLTEDVSVVSGLDYRYWTTHTEGLGPATALVPNDDDFHLGSGFIQFEVSLFDDMLTLIAGTKLSVNSWSGFEYQPSGRFVFQPMEGHAIWGAVSRAVRTPTAIDNDLNALIGPINLVGDRDFASEELLSYELGYRFFANERFTAEISAFFSDYEDASNLVGGPPGFAPVLFDNPGSAEVVGTEIEVSVLPTDWWRLTAGYAFLKFMREHDLTSVLGGGPRNRNQPKHQVTVRSVLELPGNVEFDASVYWVDGLPAVVPSLRGDNVSQYVRLDLRLGWQATDWLELALIGQNLTTAQHAEYTDVLRDQSTQVPRSGYLLATFDF